MIENSVNTLFLSGFEWFLPLKQKKHVTGIEPVIKTTITRINTGVCQWRDKVRDKNFVTFFDLLNLLIYFDIYIVFFNVIE